MTYNLSRIDRVYRDYDVSATERGGTAATLLGVDVAILVPRATPTAATVWTPASYANGVASVVLAGPDADPAGALVVPRGGGDLWIRVSDSPEVDAEPVERITVS